CLSSLTAAPTLVSSPLSLHDALPISAAILHSDFLRPAVHTEDFVMRLHGDIPFGHAFRRCGYELVPVTHFAADIIWQAAVAETYVAAFLIDRYADAGVYSAKLCGGGCTAGHAPYDNTMFHITHLR